MRKVSISVRIAAPKNQMFAEPEVKNECFV
jgi:hypothetical protein